MATFTKIFKKYLPKYKQLPKLTDVDITNYYLIKIFLSSINAIPNTQNFKSVRLSEKIYSISMSWNSFMG